MVAHLSHAKSSPVYLSADASTEIFVIGQRTGPAARLIG
jgi:hypothetical protein